MANWPPPAPHEDIPLIVQNSSQACFSDELLQQLADCMLGFDNEPGALEESRIPAGYTYFGQFIAHDLTRDRFADRPPVDLAHSGVNSRSHQVKAGPMLLTSVYGSSAVPPESEMTGPYSAEFRLGFTRPESERLPARTEDLYRLNGYAQIPDDRNDDVLPLAQTHLLFQKLHNRFVQELEAARGERHQQILHCKTTCRSTLSVVDRR